MILGISFGCCLSLASKSNYARVTHALDHRSMVHGIGEQNTTGKFSTEGRQSGIIGDVARRENQLLCDEELRLLFPIPNASHHYQHYSGYCPLHDHTHLEYDCEIITKFNGRASIWIEHTV